MIRKLDHVAVAVRNIDKHLRFWGQALGIEPEGQHTVESEGVKVAFLPAGPARVELLEPLGPDTPVGRFLAKRGEGLHHVTFEVDHLEEMVESLRQRGVKIVGDTVRTGAGDRKVVFLHPRSTGGVLVELVEPASTRGREEVEIGPGKVVLLYLRDPQEKLWGVLRRLDSAGVVLEGIDLSSFDDWMAQIERGEESVVGPSVLFVPMVRVERILLDRSSGDLPSLAERFQRRTGRSVQEVTDPSGLSGEHSD